MNVAIDSMDDFWEDFLLFVEEKRVIPIIGPDLLMVEFEGEHLPYFQLIARRLAERLRIPIDSPSPTLNEVVCRILQSHRRREEIYSRIRIINKEISVDPPAILKKMARIRDFDLFISLSFDALLAQAINAERFANREVTEHIGYAPHKVIDLPVERAKLKAPLVYSLFGKLSVGPDYVTTEEDTLEFLYALQSEAKRPHLLFDELQSSHLLMLGCGFPDWLTRFFIRIIKGRQLSTQRGESELLVDERVHTETSLVVFLENFSYGTRILSIDPIHFIDEFEQRWTARNPTGESVSCDVPVPDTDSHVLPDLPSGGVFISYAKEDVDSVRRIYKALDELGIDIWFDQNRLEAGDQYDQKIKRNIKACSLFLPIISKNTERRIEGYFRREWKLAEDRSLGIADHVPFIMPIVIDETPPYESRVPEAFHKAQWTKLLTGEMQPEFQMRIIKLVREYRKREKGLV